MNSGPNSLQGDFTEFVCDAAGRASRLMQAVDVQTLSTGHVL